jgi:cytochrome d ubiquinol oxidase subunit II
MFAVAVIFVPIVLSYTAWSYYKMWGVIRSQDIQDNPTGMY